MRAYRLRKPCGRRRLDLSRPGPATWVPGHVVVPTLVWVEVPGCCPDDRDRAADRPDLDVPAPWRDIPHVHDGADPDLPGGQPAPAHHRCEFVVKNLVLSTAGLVLLTHAGRRTPPVPGTGR